jgi:hypothetical protein
MVWSAQSAFGVTNRSAWAPRSSKKRFSLTLINDHGKLLEPLNNGLLTMLRSPQFGHRSHSIPAGIAELLVSISSLSIAMQVWEDHKP